MRTTTAALLVGSILVLAGCGASASSGGTLVGPAPTEVDGPATGDIDPAAAVVELRFTDSSVPPPYHRSYVLTLDANQVHVVVSSYSEVIGEETAPMPVAEWEAFLAGLPAALDELAVPETSAEECDGGTYTEFEVSGAGEADVTLEVDPCDSDVNVAIGDRLDELVGPFADLVDLTELTSTD